MQEEINKLRKEFEETDFRNRVESHSMASKLLQFIEKNFRKYQDAEFEELKKRIRKMEYNEEKYQKYIEYLEKQMDKI